MCVDLHKISIFFVQMTLKVLLCFEFLFSKRMEKINQIVEKILKILPHDGQVDDTVQHSDRRCNATSNYRNICHH